MTAFSVDTEALGALAERMARTRDAVARASRLVDNCGSTASAGPVAAGLVAGALADFDDHWRYGLRRIVSNLDDCHAALHDAAAAYEQVEQAIARAAAGD
jgi:uncharacterized protein YukE